MRIGGLRIVDIVPVGYSGLKSCLCPSAPLLLCSPAPQLLRPAHRAGGRVFGGGGLRIPSRNVSPVSARFQTTEMLWFSGCSIVIAPGRAFPVQQRDDHHPVEDLHAQPLHPP